MTISEMIESLGIFAKYLAKGMDEAFFMGAERDQIWMYVEDEKIPTDSDDFKRLDEIGWFPDEECGTWSRFV